MKSTLFVALRVTLLACAAFSTAAFAQSVKFETIRAGTYHADPYHTQVVFSILHFGFTDFSGIFAGASGTLQLNPTQLGDSKLDMSIGLESLTTTVSVLTRELKGAQWFDVAKFPAATFVSRKIVRTGSASAQVTGDLTLHGITKSEVFAVRLVGAGTNPLSKVYTVGFEASGKIRRGDFGVRTDLPAVGDDVTLRIAGAFEARP
ncbi:MAG TPA: YceI family protein [Steroidobacteraceae bacterium]